LGASRTFDMLLIVLLLNFFGFYSLYITSSRIAVPPLPFRQGGEKYPVEFKLLGVSLLSVALVMLLVSYGIAVGIFFFIVILSFLASLN
jgi:hypothetical protein